MMDTEFIKIFWQQYKLLEKRMIELSDYVAVAPKNFSTFSNQFISMYLTICSEIDSVADKHCSLIGITDTKDRYGITNKINKITDYYDNFNKWKCTTKFPFEAINIVPFAKFEDNKSADWWQAYNKVKHFRTDKNESGQYNYELANLKNILWSLAALYLLIYRIKTEFYNDFELDIRSEIFDVDKSNMK